jgi:ribonuclease BN (tRNA processing enzyme)
MRLTIVGCSGSFAGPLSPASSYLLQSEHEGRTWNVLLDLGSGALGALQRHLDPALLDAVFITHLHPDHCVDLLGLYVSRKYDPRGVPAERLPLWGPTGTAERLSLMYHGIEDGEFERTYAIGRHVDAEPVQVGPFTVTPHLVNHPVEAYGFRVVAGGRVLGFTGDTDTTPALTPLLTGAHLALADSAFVEGRDEAPDIHLTGRRAAEAAVAAGGVHRLMLTHLPSWNDPQVCRAQAAEVWGAGVELAEPGAAYDI